MKLRGRRPGSSIWIVGAWALTLTLGVTPLLGFGPTDPKVSTKVGDLIVATDPIDALVYVDGAVAGHTPLRVDGISVGDHRVRVSKDGFLENGRVVTIEAGRETSVNVRLARGMATAPSAPLSGGGLKKWIWIGAAAGGGAAAYMFATKNAAPSAGSITASKTTAFIGDSISFASQGASDPDGDALSYKWEFGDGASDTGATVTHSYATPGSYEAKLIVSDGKKSSTVTTTVTIRPITPPIPGSVTASPTSPLAGQATSFSVVGASDPDGRPLTFSWNFGDSTTGTGQNVTHTFVNAGTFNVVATVNDGRASATTSTSVTVRANRPPTAGTVVLSPATTIVATSVSLNVQGASDPDGQPLTYSWNFGDNTTGTGQSISHTYTSTGTFTATATVSDGGATANATATVTVKSLSGTWRGTLAGAFNTTVVISQNGTSLSGTYSDQTGSGTISGSVDSATRRVTFTVTEPGFQAYTFTADPSPDINTMAGSTNGSGFSNAPWTLVRQ